MDTKKLEIASITNQKNSELLRSLQKEATVIKGVDAVKDKWKEAWGVLKPAKDFFIEKQKMKAELHQHKQRILCLEKERAILRHMLEELHNDDCIIFKDCRKPCNCTFSEK